MNNKDIIVIGAGATGKMETLGLVASSYRDIKDGSDYSHFFPKSDVKEKIVIEDGTVKDTVKLIEQVVSKYNWQTKALSETLKRNSLPDTLNAIWDFFYSHYQYKLDRDEVEELRTPARSWHDRKTGIDCDCYSISISCVLTNLGIKHKFRVTKYGAGWQHIYVIVPVPNSIKGDYWVLDCVLDRFNYEKTYTDKFDYKMETLGIPVAILSGIDNDTELHTILSGADFDEPGFGAVSTLEDDLGALHKHLKRTRNYIRKNPHSVIYHGGAPRNIKMLNHALDNWHCPVKREKALNGLALEEHKMNVSLGLAGVNDYNAVDDTLNGIGIDEELDGVEDVDTLGKIKKPRKFFQAVKNAHKKIVAAHKKIGKKIIDAHKKVFKAVVRFNPLSLAVRGAILLVMKTNMFQIARALYPAFVSEAESKRYGYTDDQIAKAKQVRPGVEKLFVKVLQGKADSLAKQIIHGATNKRQVNGIDVLGGFENLGSATAAGASLVAASVPLTKIATLMNKAGLKDGKGVSFLKKVLDFFKKRRADKKAKGDTTEEGATDAVIAQNETAAESGSAPIDKSSIENSDSSGASDTKSSSKSSAENTSDDENKSVDGRADSPVDDGGDTTTTNKPVVKTNQTKPTTSRTTAPSAPNDTTDEEGFFAKAKTWVTENPGKATAAGVVIATGVAYAISPAFRKTISGMFGGKKKAGLSGVKRSKSQRKVKGNYSKNRTKKVRVYKLK